MKKNKEEQKMRGEKRKEAERGGKRGKRDSKKIRK